MRLEFDFSELEQFAERLVDSRLEETFKRITKDIAKALLDYIKGWTPKETTTLIKGWDNNAFLVKPVNGGYEVDIVNEVEYAAWVNDGHRSFNQFGGQYQIHDRVKVPIAHTWQNPSNDYYVFGHFFVEKGIIQIADGSDIQNIIMRELKKWWVSV